NLLDNGREHEGITRREATLKTAKIGAGVASAPLIYSILAPMPALAATQQYCLGIVGCTAESANTGFGTCHQVGCACCGPSSATIPGIKLCTADCSTTNCSTAVALAHCTAQDLTSVSCNTSDARLKRDVQPPGLDLLV